jgi:hypothetical protein
MPHGDGLTELLLIQAHALTINVARGVQVALMQGAVAQAFQQILLPDPADYRYAELPMIEE